MPVVLICQACGKSFSVPPVRARKAKYCSNACAGPQRGAAQSKPKVAIKCAKCGKVFFEHQCHAERRKFCSYKCRSSDADYLEERKIRQTGAGNAGWVGGITKHTDGYVYEYAPHHPFTTGRYVLQHRLVVEQYLREHHPDSPYLVRFGEQLYLSPKYCVHHKNEDREDNRPENLQVMTNSEHQKLHTARRRAKK